MMDEAPWGLPLTEEERLLRVFAPETGIDPDRVSPAIEGYFRLPAIWIGRVPSEEALTISGVHELHEIVLKKSLSCGIEVRVQRDGTFWFDFATWSLAPQVIIPGFRRPDVNGACKVPRFHQDAEERAEDYAVLRACVMNAHQACLTSAEMALRGRGAPMGFPVNAWSTEKAISWRALRTYHEDVQNHHALARNLINDPQRIYRTKSARRRVLEVDIVERSLGILDSILTQQDADLLRLVETTYMAACRQREKRFGEALTLGWGVCEQIISLLWTEHLKSISSQELDRMPKDRREKLTGRDYTASARIEVLELLGILDRPTYRLLEIARRARNKWMHQLKSPKESEASVSIRAAEALLLRRFQLQLRLQGGGRGGVPQWPVWIWEQVLAEERTPS